MQRSFAMSYMRSSWDSMRRNLWEMMKRQASLRRPPRNRCSSLSSSSGRLSVNQSAARQCHLRRSSSVAIVRNLLLDSSFMLTFPDTSNLRSPPRSVGTSLRVSGCPMTDIQPTISLSCWHISDMDLRSRASNPNLMTRSGSRLSLPMLSRILSASLWPESVRK